jgi:hypothetical protein
MQQLRLSDCLRARSLETTDTAEGDVPADYSARGFQPTGIGLSRTGCWLVIGALGRTKIGFVIDFT